MVKKFEMNSYSVFKDVSEELKSEVIALELYDLDGIEARIELTKAGAEALFNELLSVLSKFE